MFCSLVLSSFYCTVHMCIVQMPYVLNSYLLTYLFTYISAIAIINSSTLITMRTAATTTKSQTCLCWFLLVLNNDFSPKQIRTWQSNIHIQLNASHNSSVSGHSHKYNIISYKFISYLWERMTMNLMVNWLAKLHRIHRKICTHIVIASFSHQISTVIISLTLVLRLHSHTVNITLLPN